VILLFLQTFSSSNSFLYFKMKFASTLMSAVLAATALATPTPTKDLEKRATTMCGNWGTVATGGYTVYHNNWGAGTASSGSQCTTFTSLTSGSFVWSTSWTWAGGAGQVKSYSNVALENVNKAISAISSIPSTWKWT
jgi:xyloglucan-specific endo-beta-1,4-glucanase